MAVLRPLAGAALVAFALFLTAAGTAAALAPPALPVTPGVAITPLPLPSPTVSPAPAPSVPALLPPTPVPGSAPAADSPAAQEQTQQYQQQQAQVQVQLQDLYVQYGARALPLGGGDGRFSWPELSNTISQGFGCTEFPLEPLYPDCPTRHRHTGVDIVGPDGTPVFAAAAGIARTYAGTVGYGNFVIVVHSDEYATLYGHLRAFTVHDGDEVEQGDVIGLEGSTGLSTGPHLHFEIHHLGDYLDPIPFFLPPPPAQPAVREERGRLQSF